MSWSIDGDDGGGDGDNDDDGDGRTHIKRAVPPQVDWLNRRIKAKVFVHFRYFNDGVIWMDASQRFADDVDDDEWQKKYLPWPSSVKTIFVLFYVRHVRV